MNPFSDPAHYYGIYSSNSQQHSHHHEQHQPQPQHHHHQQQLHHQQHYQHNQHSFLSHENDSFILEGEDISWLEQSEWVKDFFEEESSKQEKIDKMKKPPTGSNPVATVKRVKSSNYEKKKVSDALTYGPRFISIFQAYCTECNKQIDIRRHLMVLCLEHLVDFIKWCRRSDAQVQRITELLYDNDYLRPEVRNGIVMVLIYTFAAIKATVLENSDMFLTLQDMEEGLGIANKYSLKIYNDPLNYLIFLKTSISSLIDAGLLPENERLTQLGGKGKSIKATSVFQEEIDAYFKVSRLIIDLLVQKKRIEVKNVVQVITTHWQLRGKTIRNRRFISALETISQPDLRDISQRDYALIMQKLREDINSVSKSAEPFVTEKFSSTDMLSVKAGSEAERYTINPSTEGYDDDMEDEEEQDGSYNSRKRKRIRKNTERIDSEDEISNVTNPTLNISKSQVNTVQSSGLPQQRFSSNYPDAYPPVSTVPYESSSHIRTAVPFTVPVLRFERIGLFEWEIKESRIFDIPNFLQSISSVSDIHLYLLNEKKFSVAFQTKKMIIDPLLLQSIHPKPSSLGLYSLEDELTRHTAIVSHWLRNDLQQFVYFLKDYHNYFCQRQEAMRMLPSETGNNPENNIELTSLSLFHFWQQLDLTISDLPQTITDPTTIITTTETNENNLSSSIEAAIGYIGYEVTIYLVLVIRKHPEIGLTNDIWCKIFPNELLQATEEILLQRKMEWKRDRKLQGIIVNEEFDDQIYRELNAYPVTFGEILIHFFPQLISIVKKYLQSGGNAANNNIHSSTNNHSYTGQQALSLSQSSPPLAYDILVKYYSVNSHNSNFQNYQQQQEQSRLSSSALFSTSSHDYKVPPMLAAAYYQTIGTFHTPAAKVMARMLSEAVLHDFVLELVL